MANQEDRGLELFLRRPLQPGDFFYRYDPAPARSDSVRLPHAVADVEMPATDFVGIVLAAAGNAIRRHR